MAQVDDRSNTCCAPESQVACCAPEAKDDCCGEPSGSGCGCEPPRDADALRARVRERYASAARSVETGRCGCGPDAALPGDAGSVFGRSLYDAGEVDGAVDAALRASLGCGVPTAVADLAPGEVVLDLGSGAGADVLLSARRVAPGGRAIGVDMTDEMLALARANAAAAGISNVEFIAGTIEQLPLPDASVDVVISNCVINLAADKDVVFREAARVLRPGGRIAISDVVADENMDAATRRDMALWTGCIAGALTAAQFREMLAAAGFHDIEITPTHRVHAAAAAAIVRARTSAS